MFESANFNQEQLTRITVDGNLRDNQAFQIISQSNRENELLWFFKAQLVISQ